MANVKDIYIEARVPFHWLNECTDDEAACFARWLMSPVSGLRYSYRDELYFANTGGGRTNTHVLVIEGQEAIRSTSVNFLIGALSRIGLECAKELVADTGRGVTSPMGLLRVAEYDIENHEALR